MLIPSRFVFSLLQAGIFVIQGVGICAASLIQLWKYLKCVFLRNSNTHTHTRHDEHSLRTLKLIHHWFRLAGSSGARLAPRGCGATRRRRSRCS